MRKIVPFCMAVCGIGSSAAQAQSNVSLYGLISAGVGHVSNERSQSRNHILSGTNQNPRWGLRGREDLGGGLDAVFGLEQGFNVLTGQVAQNGKSFGRQSYVGLSDKTLGTLTFGRQYDTVHAYLGPVLIASGGVNIGDNDNSYNNIRIQNAVRYVSPVVHGVDFTAVYGLSEGESDKDNRALSVGMGYKRDGLSLGVVHARMDKPYSKTNPSGAVADDYASSLLLFTRSALNSEVGVEAQRISGVGGLYTSGLAVVGAFFSEVEFRYLDRSSLKLRNFNASLNYAVAKSVILGISYTLTTGRYDIINTHPKWHQVNLQANYVLSHRTDLFTNYTLQRAAGDALNAQIFGFGPSTDRQQALVTFGARHRF